MTSVYTNLSYYGTSEVGNSKSLVVIIYTTPLININTSLLYKSISTLLYSSMSILSNQQTTFNANNFTG